MVNDISIAAGIFFLFVLLGVLMPFVNADFNSISTSPNTEGLTETVGNEMVDVNVVSLLDVVKSIAGMFFWTFGQLPFWLDAIFVVLRLIFAFIIARNIWIGGGA